MMWFFTRVSGVLMLLMGGFSLVYANLAGGQGNMDAGAQMRWAFFPISFHVESTAVEVTPNFANAFWQVYGFALMALAATHALNGIRVLLTDYVRHPLLAAWLKAAFVGLWVAAMIGAIFLVFVYAG